MTEVLLPPDLSFDGPFPRLARRLRLGVVGGGRISVTQAMAARLSDRWEVVAGALSSDAEKAKARGADWFLPAERCYASFEEMAQAEAARSDGVDAVMITTPNHVHFDAARAFLSAGIDAELLRSPNRCCAQVFVQAFPENDIVRIQTCLCGAKLLVITAEWRAAIPVSQGRNEAFSTGSQAQ